MRKQPTEMISRWWRFEPTKSFYTFYRLADPDDIKRFGLVSPEPDVARHAGPPDAPVTPDQMKRKGMTHSLASDAAKAK
jgi:hypothetical protein